MLLDAIILQMMDFLREDGKTTVSEGVFLAILIVDATITALQSCHGGFR